MSKLSIIAAVSKNNAIGINNTLPWNCPEDLAHFKSLTMGHPIIMGRKTFESIGRALPGRTSIVVTRNPELKANGCLIAKSIQDAVEMCDKTAFVIGGAEIYRQALPFADAIFLTEIQKEVEGDAFFPEFDRTEWREVVRDERFQVNPEPLRFNFLAFERNA